jgi:hypothetical protein
MSTTLTQAFQQWASRPADQRFSSLEAIHAAVSHHREIAREATNVDLRTLRVSPIDVMDNGKIVARTPMLAAPSGQMAKFTHYSFGQFARRVSAPAHYLRTLPADLVAENLNHGLRTLPEATTDALLFSENGDGLTLRCDVSEKYSRIWNVDITSRLLRLNAQHPEWQPAPAAFDGSRGLYASDRDIFCFLVDNDRRIFESLPGGGLGRGFFVWNSEVGDKSFGVMTFLYEYVCGNHRVWGAKGISELRIPHIGDADARAFRNLEIELRKYADASVSDDEAKITRCRAMELGATKDEVLDRVFGLRIAALSQKVILAAYDRAEQEADKYGSPRSVWGFTGGLTEIARDAANADERVTLDRAAGKVMQIAF